MRRSPGWPASRTGAARRRRRPAVPPWGSPAPRRPVALLEAVARVEVGDEGTSRKLCEVDLGAVACRQRQSWHGRACQTVHRRRCGHLLPPSVLSNLLIRVVSKRYRMMTISDVVAKIVRVMGTHAASCHVHAQVPGTPVSCSARTSWAARPGNLRRGGAMFGRMPRSSRRMPPMALRPKPMPEGGSSG